MLQFFEKLKEDDMSYSDVKNAIDELERENNELKRVASELVQATSNLIMEIGVNQINDFGYNGTFGQQLGRAALDNAIKHGIKN